MTPGVITTAVGDKLLVRWLYLAPRVFVQLQVVESSFGIPCCTARCVVSCIVVLQFLAVMCISSKRSGPCMANGLGARRKQQEDLLNKTGLGNTEPEGRIRNLFTFSRTRSGRCAHTLKVLSSRPPQGPLPIKCTPSIHPVPSPAPSPTLHCTNRLGSLGLSVRVGTWRSGGLFWIGA